MESSEVVREKEHPFAKKRGGNSSYFSCINGFMSFFTVFSQEAYPFLYEIL